ncbi:MAG: hypothetical protein Aurels2KO_50390 [Aureliella sp.]
MAYWGLARCQRGDRERADEFLNEAIARKDRVSRRERMYIELWDLRREYEKAIGDEKEEQLAEYARLFDNLLIDFPDDVEARALYWHEMSDIVNDSAQQAEPTLRYALDGVLKEVLADQPEHVGALHYRVHNWDGKEGRYAREACLALSQLAPQSGHLQHMPGHVLSSIGLWHEAAIAMDKATRVEKEYMRKRFVLPEDNWDYLHNLDYLAYLQEQLGMYEAALSSCKQLQAGPQFSRSSLLADFSNLPMLRVLIKFEKWNEILDRDGQYLRWRGTGFSGWVLMLYGDTRAYIGIGDLESARESYEHLNNMFSLLELGLNAMEFTNRLRSLFSGKPSGSSEGPNLVKEIVEIKKLELKARLTFAAGERSAGIEMMREAAAMQAESWMNDPPRDAEFLYNSLGELLLEQEEYSNAAKAFQKSLETVKEDGFALSGLVFALNRTGDTEGANTEYKRLKRVWRDAPESNRLLRRARDSFGQPIASTTESHLTTYGQYLLEQGGYSCWVPPQAPALEAVDATGQTIELEHLRGKNVVLIFYLGGQCIHCVEQLQAINALSTQFEDRNTVILAVSKDDVQTIADYQEDLDLRLLSDSTFDAARRFFSYDDFEDIELHSTLLINADSQVHWSVHGGEPFMDFKFLLREIDGLETRRQSAAETGKTAVLVD